jgi:hypothetical protein
MFAQALSTVLQLRRRFAFTDHHREGFAFCERLLESNVQTGRTLRLWLLNKFLLAWVGLRRALLRQCCRDWQRELRWGQTDVGRFICFEIRALLFAAVDAGAWPIFVRWIARNGWVLLFEHLLLGWCFLWSKNRLTIFKYGVQLLPWSHELRSLRLILNKKARLNYHAPTNTLVCIWFLGYCTCAFTQLTRQVYLRLNLTELFH